MISTSFIISEAMNDRFVVSAYSSSILANITIFFLTNSPSISPHIDEIDIPTRVSHIASQSHRVKKTLMDFYIFQCYISQSNSRLCGTCAMFIEWIQHATRPISIRLFHLLRSNIDSPPNRSIHGKVLIVDILNKPSALIPRIGLNIDSFEWPYHPNIFEGNIPDTVTPLMWRNTAHTHTNPKNNSSIFNIDILCTIASPVALMAGFRDNYIIVVLHCQVVDLHTCTCWVDAVCVQGEKRNCSYQG